MKKIFLVLVIVSFSLLIGLRAGMAENVGNKICPVTGEKINEKTKATYEHEGVTYNFCCPMCIDTFRNDTKQYVGKVEKELQENESQVESAPSHDMHEGHHH